MEEKFLKYIDALEYELSKIKTHYEIFKEISEAVDGEFYREFQQAQSFWIRTVFAHLDVCLFGLMRILVDKGSDGAPFLVGAVAFEQLGLGVDPSGQKLVPDLPVLLRSADRRTL